MDTSPRELVTGAAVLLRGVARSGLLRPVRLDRLAGMAAALARHGLSLPTITAVGAARWPDREAIVDEQGGLTHAELHQRAEAIAATLAEWYGLARGSRVGILCRNHAGFVEAAVGAARLGADLVLLNTDFSDSQLADVLAREHLDLTIHDAEFIPTSPGATCRHDALLGHATRASCRHVALPRTLPPGRITLLTSGSTGTPKGAERAVHPPAMALPAGSLLATMRLRSGEPMLVLPPLFHGFGFAYLVLGLALGCPVVLLRRFDAHSALEAIRHRGVRTVFGVPVMLQRIARLPERSSSDTRGLRAVGSAAAPLSPELTGELTAAFGSVVHNLYGSTETGWASIATPEDLRAAPGTVGRPVHGVTVRVLDSRRKPLPAGQLGSVFVGSSIAFSGYSGGGGRELADGLMHTGDLGHFDTEGRLFVDGREDDMIVSGGENVHPQEVQDLLAAHPDVEEAHVTGVADEEFGQRLAAMVVAARHSKVTAEQLREHVRTHLARFKVPRDIEFAAELPRNATGKVRRR